MQFVHCMILAAFSVHNWRTNVQCIVTFSFDSISYQHMKIMFYQVWTSSDTHGCNYKSHSHMHSKHSAQTLHH